MFLFKEPSINDSNTTTDSSNVSTVDDVDKKKF